MVPSVLTVIVPLLGVVTLPLQIVRRVGVLSGIFGSVSLGSTGIVTLPSSGTVVMSGVPIGGCWIVSGTLVVVALKLGVLLVKVAVLPILVTEAGVVVFGLAWKETVPLLPAFTVPKFHVRVLVVELKLHVTPLVLGLQLLATYSRLVSSTSVTWAVLKFAVPVLAYGMVYVTTSSLVAPVGLL